jgi:hypothetical protein
MSGKKWIIVAAVALFLVVAVIAGVVVLSPPKAMPLDGTAAAVVRQTPNADGSMTIEVEVKRGESWHWDKVEISQVQLIAPGTGGANARLTTAPPVTPIPERFVLSFQTDPIPLGGEPDTLAFAIHVEATRMGGASGGSQSRSYRVPLGTDPDANDSE